ncbi:hypothetical protein [Pistricoccus aurantiacus]|uniref:hypothetical protein n=1 Tax=Pistricoccus aurantiacus TaxID=1883414 RepID=UPI003632F2E3
MSKRFNTLETTRILLEHAGILLGLIQRMDVENLRYLREFDLQQALIKHGRHVNAQERRRLQRAFSSDNLFHANLVIDIDKVEGERRLVFHESLLELLRLCDLSLHRELTDARLRTRLVALWDLNARLEAASFSEADADFTELADELNAQLSQLIGLLRQNVVRMQGVSADLAEISGEASRAPEHFATFRQSMLARIATLYERHIKPALAFLNPDTRLADGANLFATLETLVRLFERHGKQDRADQIFRVSLSLNAMHKPIQTVAREVDNFLRKTRRGMLQYNAIEHHYGRLLDALERTRTRDLRVTRLSGGDFLRGDSFVSGLKGFQRPRSYAFGESASYYRLLFSEIELRLADQRRRGEAPALPDMEASLGTERIDAQRIQKLFHWIDILELRPTEDLVRELHGRLDDFIDGYRFPDLLAVLNRLAHAQPQGMRIHTTNRFRLLEGEAGDLYIYRRRRLEKESSA